MTAPLQAGPFARLRSAFAKAEISGEPGVWMRRFGAPLYGLPNLAMHVTSHELSAGVLDRFERILDYVESSGAILKPGDTM